MPSTIIYPDGGLAVDVVIPSTESIAVYTRGTATVYQKVITNNFPARKNKIGTVINGQTVFGAYANGATLEINAGASPVYYQVGASPVVTERKGLRLQEAPGVLNATGTLTAALILSGVVTSSTAAAVTATLDTGAIMDASGEHDIGDSFDWSAINTGGANAFTVTASSGHTVVGAGAVAANSSGLFRTRKTAADTFITYRIG
jgi:hypothetical protein